MSKKLSSRKGGEVVTLVAPRTRMTDLGAKPPNLVVSPAKPGKPPSEGKGQGKGQGPGQSQGTTTKQD